MINEKRLVQGKFQWQAGYGAFSYSKSQLLSVVNYIQNQETHHQKNFCRRIQRVSPEIRYRVRRTIHFQTTRSQHIAVKIPGCIARDFTT